MEGMEIVCTKAKLSSSWSVELLCDGEVLESARDIRPACATRKVINQYVFNNNDSPKSIIRMKIIEWE